MRAVEILYALDEALRLIDGLRAARPARVEVAPRAGVGYGWTEAPRGMLWHRYEIDGDGTILDARIVPPTSQNQGRIEQSLHGFVQQHVELADEELRLRCEQAVRSYDPCISCATHFLRLEVDRGVIVIGVGNALARRRRRRPRGRPARARARAGGVEVRELEGDATALLDAWAGAEHVVVVDAARRARRRAPSAASTPPPRRCRCAACAPRRTPSASPTPSSWRARSAACRAGSTSTRSRARASSPATA